MAQTRAVLSELTVASQDPSGAIATPAHLGLVALQDGAGGAIGGIPMGQVMVCRG